jgi:GDPmannose 4,6-dehydratase
VARTGLITGSARQDGSCLSELLLEKGHHVHGMVRGSPSESYPRLSHLGRAITLDTGDLLDAGSLDEVMRACEPDEVYNLAGIYFVAASRRQPVLAAELNAVGVVRLLEAMREVVPEARFSQASSSEVFGTPRDVPQTELAPSVPPARTARPSATGTS